MGKEEDVCGPVDASLGKPRVYCLIPELGESKMEVRYEMLVNGKMTGGSRALDVVDPATAEVLRFA